MNRIGSGAPPEDRPLSAEEWEVAGQNWAQDLASPQFAPPLEGVLLFGRWVDKELVAFIAYKDLGGVLEIQSLATHSSFRGQGHQKGLFEAFIQQIANPLQVSEIWLEVHEANAAARALYQSLGFVVAGRRPGYYGDGGAALTLTKKLPIALPKS